MDTTTVNFAIGKMTEAWKGIAPSVENVSEKYIDFVVMRACILPFITLPIGIILTIICVKITKKLMKSGLLGDHDVPLGVICGLSGTLAFACMCTSFIGGYDAILALTNPEKFLKK